MEKRPQLVILDTMNFWMDLTWDLLLEVIAKQTLLRLMMKKRVNFQENILW